MKAKNFVVAAVGAILVAGCAKDTATVVGRFTGHCDETVYIEQIVPGRRETVDSAVLNKKGDFRFRVRLHEGGPTLYNVKYGHGAIPLLLSPGERATVNSLCDVALNYTVEGSDESARIRELQMLLIHGGLKLDSLRRVFFSSEGEGQRDAYVEYVDEMNRVKREHLRFIVSEPGSLSSLYALYQRLAGEQSLLAADKDIIYYRLIADSTEVSHPGSPYVAALRREVDAADKTREMRDVLADRWRAGGDGYPDLALPDMYGVQHILSSLEGKVVLVDFWHSSDPVARLNNAELKALYEQAHGRGFEVYQVSLDTQKAPWVAAIQDQRLPWLSVGDMSGPAGTTARQYNITALPDNFLIDREGTIVGRGLYGEKLAREVEKIL
jgi:peroxiredoxin